MKKTKPHGRPRTKGGHAGPARPGAVERGEWLFGTHAVLAALENPDRVIRRFFATTNGVEHLPEQPIRQPEIVPPATLEAQLPRDAVHQGLALLAEPLPERDLEETCDADGLVLALDQVTDPHNVGAILRSAAAFGARAVILTERHAPQAIGTLAKAASGALEHVPLVRIVNLATGLSKMKELGYEVLGLAEHGPVSLDAVKPGDRTLVVLGAEGTGLRRLTRERCDRLVRLPTQGPIGSLNVSNAAAVALYALSRSS
jgi:23S rRNA (guanosine2251-2'-O)-methyltransferase